MSTSNTQVVRRAYGGKLLGVLVAINLVVIGMLTFWEVLLDYDVWGRLGVMLITINGIGLALTRGLLRNLGIAIALLGVLGQYGALLEDVHDPFAIIWAITVALYGAVVVALNLVRPVATRRRAAISQWSGVVLGVNLIGIGTLTFWEVLLDYGVWENLFPLLIMASGAVLLRPSDLVVRILGVAIILNGVLAQYATLVGDVNDLFVLLWSLLMVLFGLGLLVLFFVRRGGAGGSDTESTTVVFGERNDTISGEFKGRSATSIFGTTRIDLTQATATAPVEVNVTTILGETRIALSREWRVDLRATTLLGEQRAAPQFPDAEPMYTLVVTGLTAFGDLSVTYEA